MSDFWLYNPLVLFDKEHILEFWPNNKMSLTRKMNAIARSIITLTLIGFLFTQSVKLLITSVITLVVLVILYKTQYEKKQLESLKESAYREGFEGRNSDKFIDVFNDNFTTPTKQNPMMNVLMTDYADNPQRKMAAPSYNKRIAEKINDKSIKRNKLYQDLGDNLAFEHQMRNFHSMPNTTIPNNQRGFAEFCYGNMPSCKGGDDEQCNKSMRKIGGQIYY